MAPEDFLTLKQKIQSSTILSDSEKKEWLFLLPKMKPEQVKELDRILSIKLPIKTEEQNSPLPNPRPNDRPVGQAPHQGEGNKKINSSPLGGEGKAGGLVRHFDVKTPVAPQSLPVPPAPKPPLPNPPPQGEGKRKEFLPLDGGVPVRTPSSEFRVPKPPPKPPLDFHHASPLVTPQVEAPVAKPSFAPGQTLTVEQIKSLSVSDLRRASAVYPFLETMAQSMRLLLRNQQATPESLAWAFEQSPLYETYVEVGLAKMTGKEPDALSHEEFEALTDFRSAMKKILQN